MNIKTWLERVYDETPSYRGQWPEDGGFLSEVGCIHKEDEIDDLRNAIEEMLGIFQWMNDNPGCHANNMRSAAKSMLEKFGDKHD